jgi:bifunctional DNase/RNase
MHQMQVAQIGVAVGAGTLAPLVLLRDETGERYLPIWIGAPEADAIARAGSGSRPQRPMTHELIGKVYAALGAHLERIVITDLRDGVYYAELVFDADVRVSARPSDAIALALGADASIHAEDSVLDQAGVPATALQVRTGERPNPDAEAELGRFRDFLEGARPEDFDPGEDRED